MSEPNEEIEVSNEPTITIEDRLADMQKKMDDLAKENLRITSENAKNKQTIATFETTLAEELDKIKKPSDPIKVEDPKPELDGSSLLEKVLNKRKEQEAQFDKELELTETEKENARIRARNSELEFRMGINDLIDKDPYLADFIKEGIDEKRFNRIEDVKMGLTPSVRKALQYTYSKSKEWEKAGRDPMEMYTGIEQATNQEVKSEKREKNLKNWAKLLG